MALSLHRQPTPLLIHSRPQSSYNHIIENTSDYTHNTRTTSNRIPYSAEQPLFDIQPQQFTSSPSLPLMQTDTSNQSWFPNGQLTPTSTTRRHHRESSLSSSLGSTGPASPYTANTSNPHIAAGGEVYHDFHDYHSNSSKPLTPAVTPLQESFQYTNIYQNPHTGYTMVHDGLPKTGGDVELMAAPEFNINNSGRPSIATVASRDSPSTPPTYEDERHKNSKISSVDFWSNDCLPYGAQDYRNTMPKLDRTMTDAYNDELYSPSFHITAAPAATNPPATSYSPQNDIFSQRLQAANSQHLSASNTQTPLTIPTRERSPFRQGSPLAPTGNFGGSRFGTATHMREQQKAENDARALQQQFERASPSEQSTPKTISPKDVDLVYHENDEDAKMPLFPQSKPQRRSPTYRQQPAIAPETSELDDTASQQSYGSMATSRRESSSASAFSATSQATPQQGSFNFATPSIPASSRQIPQQYPFVPQTRRQPSNLSNVSEEFPATLTSMESSSSEYALETSDRIQRPIGTTADTGTYTCTYHGCTLRFDTPAKLQRHKREGHRNSASAAAASVSNSLGGGVDDGGMTSAAQRNSQAGPHKCERINPSTGKPCNTIFSRPYDLTRHEDTIHNARKQKVHCPLCTEEKTFSRNDALTRHLRVVHPEHMEQARTRRRGGHD